MLAGKAAASDAVWHSNRDGKASKAAFLKVLEQPRRQPARKRRAASKMPQFIAPQLCRRVSRPPVGSDWVHEIKLDGYRMQLRVAGGEAVMRTRKGLDWTSEFAAIADAGGALDDCIIDGEVVALDHNGVPDFAALQAALSEGLVQRPTSHLICCMPGTRICGVFRLPIVRHASSSCYATAIGPES